MVLSMEKWVGKVAIVTGASSGIGAAIAETLVKNGLIVVGVARRLELLEQLSKKLSGQKGKLHPYKADITKESEVLELFEWIGKNLKFVHILVNNAGKILWCDLTEDGTDWKSVFDVNVLALCVVTREAVKMMKTNNINGYIVHMNSICGHEVYNIPKLCVYPASKFAVTALAGTLRLELKSLGLKIKVTSVSPGLVESEMTTLNPVLTEETRNKFAKMPILKPQDVADGVVFVLSTPEHVEVEELIVGAVGEQY